MLITSRNNSLLREARAVRDGKIEKFIFVEGLRLCEEALDSRLPIDTVIISTELAQKEKAVSLISKLENVSRRIASVSEKLLESISYTRTPQGIILLAARPDAGPERLNRTTDNKSLLVVMHELNNPVNVGAVLRTSEAAGVTGVITTRKTTDPFSPKALRGAMGSAFRLPIWSGPSYQDVMDWCQARGVRTVCADAGAPVAHTQVDWTGACALILGPESSGLSTAEISASTSSVKIPMHGQVESLNVSVAAGILLYEAARQRQTIAATQ